VTGVDVILAALVAGAAAGTSDAAKGAMVDLFGRLRDMVRGRFAGRAEAAELLATLEPESDMWRAQLATHLERSGLADDDEVLAAAYRLLAIADPDGTAAGRYIIDTSQSQSAETDTVKIHVGHNNAGVVANSIFGGVSLGGVPNPPQVPETR
jgi:hypothetical protein